MPVLDPWPLLRSVRQFSIQVLTHAHDGLRTAHAGSGQLQVEQLDSPEWMAVIWRERGRWTSGPLAGIPFRNTSAWRMLPDKQAIELSHLRRGDDTPTFLVRLDPTASGVWVSSEPHACGLDRYSAALYWDSAGLRLSWDVQSPTEPFQLLFDARVPVQPGRRP